MSKALFYVYLCEYCGAQQRFRRPLPTGRQIFCGIECLVGHESDLKERVNSIQVEEIE